MINNRSLALIVTILTIGIWGLCCGYHYGWVDDIQDLNVIKGSFVNGCSLFDPVNFIFIQNILRALYGLVPAFPWFGCLLYGLLAYAIYTLSKLLIMRLRISGIRIKVLIAALFTMSFMLESVNAINFTEVAILVAGLSLIDTWYTIQDRPKRIRGLLSHLCPWLIAFLIRPDVVFAVTLLIILLLILRSKIPVVKSHLAAISLVLLVFLAFFVYVRVRLYQSDEYRRIMDYNSYLYTMLDAYQKNSGDIKTAQDSLLFESIVTWNSFDKYKFNLDFLKKVGFEHPLRTEILHTLPLRVQMLANESQKYKGYHELYNWDIKLAFIIGINLLLVIWQLAHTGFNRTRIFLTHIMFWSFMLAVGIFIKMENRFLFPLCACYTLLNLLSLPDAEYNRKHRDKLLMAGIILGLGLMSVFLLRQNIVMARELNSELKIKRAFWRQLKGLKGKIFVYDLHALLLLHDSPFHEVNLPAGNENVVANHFYLAHFTCLSDYYISKTGSDSINRIIDYLHTNRERVYMISHDYDLDFLQRYMHTVYHVDYSFRRDTSLQAIDALKHNYIWWPLNFGVYRFNQ